MVEQIQGGMFHGVIFELDGWVQPMKLRASHKKRCKGEGCPCGEQKQQATHLQNSDFAPMIPCANCHCAFCTLSSIIIGLQILSTITLQDVTDCTDVIWLITKARRTLHLRYFYGPLLTMSVAVVDDLIDIGQMIDVKERPFVRRLLNEVNRIKTRFDILF